MPPDVIVIRHFKPLDSSAGLDTSPLVLFRLVLVLSNCVHWYFQMHALFHPSSWAIFITRLHLGQLADAFIQSDLQQLKHTNGGVNHARRQPDGQE